MKKIFNKISKIMFIACMVALIILILRVFVTALAILGGEYMIADHNKEKEKME